MNLTRAPRALPAAAALAKLASSQRQAQADRHRPCLGREGKVDIENLIARVIPLEKINDAFGLMHDGKSIRSVITF